MDQPLPQVAAAADDVAPDAAPASGVARARAALLAIGPGRLAVLAATALGLLGFFTYLVLRVAEPDYTLLYGGLELDDSSQIVGRLEAMGVSFRLQGDGTTILVPAEQALRLRLTLAEEGLPRGGMVGDEIFDQASPLGTTNFLANVNLRRALEGELARTIAALADVRAARVHLVLPKRELFRRDQIEPSASISLHMVGGRHLTSRQVLAVRHLVAAAVPGLVPERITVVDDRGTLLARGGDEDPAEAMPSQAEEFRADYESRLERAIEQLLARSLGPGRVHAEVAADLDFDQVTTTEEIYDPDGRVVRSTQTVEEEKNLAERDTDEAVTVANNLPTTGADTPAAARTSNEETNRVEETINYEISRTVRNHTQMGGRVRRLSVAVLVDGRMVPGEDGVPVYTALDETELAELDSLVRSAIGFDAARGDVVEVRNMPFSEPPLEAVAEDWLALTKYDLMRLGELAALVLVGLMLVLLVVRPTLDRVLPPALPAGGPVAALPGAGEAPALAGTGPGALVAPSPTPALAPPRERPGAGGQQAEAVEVENVEGRVPAGLIGEARNLIERSPDEAVAILRAWLRET